VKHIHRNSECTCPEGDNRGWWCYTCITQNCDIMGYNTYYYGYSL